MKAAGPGFGYYPNAAKTVLLVKPQFERKAREAFQGTGVTITCDGSRYLGGAIGEEQFCTSHFQQLVAKWTEELKSLIELAGPQPQSAYAVLTKGLVGKWLYHLRCSPCPPPPNTSRRWMPQSAMSSFRLFWMRSAGNTRGKSADGVTG